MEAKDFPVTVARGDTRAFLTAMLKGEESVVRQQGGILVTEDGEDAALMFGTMGLGRRMRGRDIQQDGRSGGDLQGINFSSFAPSIKHDLENERSFTLCLRKIR